MYNWTESQTKNKIMTLQFEIPEMIDLETIELKMIMAGELYKRGKMSLGQAAKLVGISKSTFIETMGNYGYSVFGSNEEDILNDIKNQLK
jgi:predicted HTH domain antitoxin